MIISVLIPSRGRPLLLQDAITSLACRESGRHKIAYIVGCDDDDPATIAMAQSMGIRAHVAPRAPSLGGVVNALSLAAPADVYCSLYDDIVCLTPGWDARIAAAWKARRDGVWWWRNSAEATYAIVSEKWRQAAGRMFTPYFPFWWDDVWLIQVWKWAYGGEPLVLGCELDDQSTGTTRMRDLKFWTDFFWSRSGERIAEAKKIAANLGWPEPTFDKRFSIVSNQAYVANIPNIEAGQGEREPPTPEYLKAKAFAQSMMKAA